MTTVLDELEHLSAMWDYRSGRSRLMFHAANDSRTDDRARLVYRAAHHLGLLDSPAPTMVQPDYLIILGGLATGVEPRVRYAAELIERRAISAIHVVALSSFRPLDVRENDVVVRYASCARTELDIVAAMIGRMFGADSNWTVTTEGDPLDDPARAQEVRHWIGQPDISLYAARSSHPDQRPANTIDTYRQFAHDVALADGQELLIITSTIYRPYQHLDALRALGRHGVTIETVGVPTSPLGGPVHPPSAYLQEIRSTLRSARALAATLS